MAISQPEQEDAFIGREEGDLGDAEELYDLRDDDRPQDESGSDESIVADQSVQSFGRHREAVFSVAWSPGNEGVVASGGADDSVFLWQAGDTSAESNARELTGHTDTVSSLAFNHAGNLLASGGLDGHVRIWESTSGRCLHTLEGPSEGVEWLSWHPLGNIIIAGSEDFSVWMWNAQTGAFMQVFNGHSSSVTCGSFTPDGKHIVTGGGENDASVRIWNPKSGECTTFMQGHGFHQAGITALAAQEDGSTTASGSEDGLVCISNLHTGRILGQLPGHTDSVEALAFSRVLPLLVSGAIDGKILIWDVATLTLRGTCFHPEGVVRLACHPTEPAVISACLDGAVRLWDLRTGEIRCILTGHTEGIQAMAASSDGDYVITGSDDTSVKIFGLPVAQVMHAPG